MCQHVALHCDLQHVALNCNLPTLPITDMFPPSKIPTPDLSHLGASRYEQVPVASSRTPGGNL